MSRRLGLVMLFLGCAAVARGAEDAPPADAKPKAILQLEAGGPTAAVTALVFSKDGNTLYAAGLDKVVRVWEQDDKKGGWTLKRSFRVPIGPGVSGAINAMALSPDGRWLAVGGRSVMRGESEFRQPGLVVPIAALSETMWRDGGTIHVFDLRNPAAGKQLRGHQGEVRALAFAPERKGKPPLLVSAAYEFAGGKPVGGSVRLWNVEKGGEALAVLEKKLPALQLEKPGLAVWHTGDGDKDVRAAIAWPESDAKSGDGHFHLWDAAAGTLKSWDFGSGNGTAVLLDANDDEALVAAGSVRKTGASRSSSLLSVLQFSRDRDPPTTRRVEFLYDEVSYRPLALAPVSSQANGRFDYVAAVLQAGKKGFHPMLALTDIAANPATVSAHFALENPDPNQTSVIAAAPRGKWLAVAGFADRAIVIYAIDDLLARKMEPAARLHSKGILYSKAVFVRRDKEMGLWLSEDANAEPLKDGMFFSFDKRTLTNDAKGWTDDMPGRAGWKVMFKDGTAIVSHGDTVSKMALQPGQQPTWYALRPSTPQHKQALLAVAHTNRDTAETYITLFDVASSRPLRQFTGHLQDVRWLAFSETHPLLVSASEDQTIAVWSFADLGAGVGMIDGLVVGERDGKVVVRSVAANSAAAKAGLKSGDVIEGLVVNDKVQPAASAVDFYWTVNLKKPGDTVDVKIVGKAAVRVAVGYGVEERKPLLSLFVTHDRHEWIGWTPGGPFDRSSDNAEALIGWHVNTGKPEQPATFVAAGQYKDEFYRPNILRYLVAEGNLSGALKEWEKDKVPPPDPELSPGINGANRDLQRPDLFHVRQKNVKLTATLITADYPLDAGDEVRWQAVGPDGKKVAAQPMKHVRDRSWEADLSALPWKQGEFHIEVLFRSTRYDKKTSQALTLRYQPPAPHLAGSAEKKDLKADAEPVVLTVMEPKIAVQVSVKPEQGQTAEVRFVQPGAKETPKPRSVAKDETFPQDFTLHEGDNDLEIVAVNKDALNGFESDETSVLRLRVKYQKPEKQAPPRIAALRLSPAGESKRDPDGTELVVVTVPHLDIASTIEADHPLTVAEWSAGADKAKSLLDPQSAKKLDVRQTVDLKAGKTTTLHLRAQTKTSEPAETTLRVVYRPLLPRFTIGQAEEGSEVFVNKATIVGEYQPGTPNEPYQVTVRVTDAQGKEVGTGKAMIDAKKESWSAVVPLAPGENVVKTIVQSEWRLPVTERLPGTIAYKRPPTIDPIAEIMVGKTPLVKIVANAWSPSGVKLLGATVDGREWHGVDLQEANQIKNGMQRWTVTLKDVPVKDGEQWRKTLVVNVRNADGLGRTPATIKITPPVKPVPVAPVVKMQVPDQDTAQQSKYSVPIFVQSDSPLKRVEVWRGDERYPRDLRKVKKNGAKFELRETVEVSLEWEANRLRLVAVNDGGEASASAVVSLPRPPVRVVVDKIDEMEPNAGVKKTREPLGQTGEQVAFDRLERNSAFLHGHIEWGDDQAPQLTDARLTVVVYVNGSRQFPVALQPRGTGKQRNQRAFGVPMFLPKKDGNKVEIEVPARVKQEEPKRSQLALDCTQAAEKQQRLHVLIIGINVKDGEKLKTNMLTLFGAEAPRGFEGEFKAPAYSRARLAGVLFDNVRKEDVFGRLGEIEKQIQILQEQTGWQNDVVLLFMQGNEDEDAHHNRYLRTSLTERLSKPSLEKTAIAYKDLPHMPGIQLTLLNVTQLAPMGDAAAERDGRQVDPRVGVMHYVWRDVNEMRNPAPAVLTYFDDATKTKKVSTLGEIADDVTKQVKQSGKAVAQQSYAEIPPDLLKGRFFSLPR